MYTINEFAIELWTIMQININMDNLANGHSYFYILLRLALILIP